MNNVLAGLNKPFFILAPMDDVTDTVFRQVVGWCAPPDVYYTEFVNVDGLQSPGRPSLMKKLLHGAENRPVIAQLWGKEPENFRKTASELADMGFAGIDLNMGCPAKSEVNNGTCSALINNRPLAGAIIKATQEGVAGRLPVSVKTRIGFNTIDLTWLEFLLEHDLEMLVVHGRTRKEMSKVPAHWDVIGQVRELRDRIRPETLLVGNGDVRDRDHGLELAGEYGLDGIMIGRGLFHDPYAFSSGNKWERVDRQARIDLYRRHVTLFAETWQHRERPIQTLNKFCKVYINGFDGAKELRESLMKAQSSDELLAILATN